MSCDRAGEVHAYHDGELDASRVAVVEAHLVKCGECRDLLRELRGLSALVARGEMPAMPDDAMARLEAAWPQVSERALLRITSWMTGVAAALLVGALAVWSTVRDEAATRMMAADPIVLATAAEPPDEPSSELIQVAQWIADDLSIGVEGSGRR